MQGAPLKAFAKWILMLKISKRLFLWKYMEICWKIHKFLNLAIIMVITSSAMTKVSSLLVSLLQTLKWHPVFYVQNVYFLSFQFAKIHLRHQNTNNSHWCDINTWIWHKPSTLKWETNKTHEYIGIIMSSTDLFSSIKYSRGEVNQ